MVIKKGMKFRCIKDVIAGTGERYYTNGKLYTSEMDDCITDDDGTINHWWGGDYINSFFEEIKEEPIKYDLKKTVVHCTTREELDEVVKWNLRQGHVKYPSINTNEWYEKHCDRTYVELREPFGYGNVDDLDCDILVLLFSQFERDFLQEKHPNKKEVFNKFINIPSAKNNFKYDKLRWELLPLNLIEELVKVYHYKAKKYYSESWKEIPNGYERLKASALRHLVAFEKGEINDPESGLPHLIQASWNLLTCYYYSNRDNQDEKK